MRQVAIVVLVILMALAVATVAVYAVSESRLNTHTSLPSETLAVPTDIGSVQHGQHLVGAIALCTQCHGSNLTGSVVFDDNTARVVAPNITRAAGLGNVDYARAIRDGLDPTGRVLWSMPSDEYNHMDDADLGAVIAYLQSLPAISTTLPPSEIRPLGRALLAFGALQLTPAARIDRSAHRPAPVQASASPVYGQYLVELAGCARCHGPALGGGRVPGAPANAPNAPNLTPAALADWSEADFTRAMRSGRRPDNQAIDTSMPWPYYAQMTDLELRAIWQFLGVIPAFPPASS